MNGEPEITTWRMMKQVMHCHFIPNYYCQEMYLRLQSLRQGGMSVEDYVKEFEMLTIRSKVEEPQEKTIARFITGLKFEIASIVELQTFHTLEEAINLACKVERQRKRIPHKSLKSHNQGSNSNQTFSDRRPKRIDGNEIYGRTDGRNEGKGKTVANASGANTDTQIIVKRSNQIKCFKCLGYGHIVAQCPNHKVMVAVSKQTDIVMQSRGEIHEECEEGQSIEEKEDQKTQEILIEPTKVVTEEGEKVILESTEVVTEEGEEVLIESTEVVSKEGDEIQNECEEDGNKEEMDDHDVMEICVKDKPHSLVTVEETTEPQLSLLMPRILPLPIASETMDHSISYQVHVPSFHFYYVDPLLGLRSIPAYCNHLMPMKTFEIFVDIHWNIEDDYVYWRSVVIWFGHAVERIVVSRQRTTGFSSIRVLADTPLEFNTFHHMPNIKLIHDVILQRNPIANTFVILGMVGYCFCRTMGRCFLSGKFVPYVEEF